MAPKRCTSGRAEAEARPAEPQYTECLVCYAPVSKTLCPGLQMQCGHWHCEPCTDLLAEHCSICKRSMLNVERPCILRRVSAKAKLAVKFVANTAASRSIAVTSVATELAHALFAAAVQTATPGPREASPMGRIESDGGS